MVGYDKAWFDSYRLRYTCNDQREKLVVAIVRPILLAVGFVVKLIYAVLFAWWVHPRVQRKGNAKLIGEIQAQLAFLVLQDSANMKAIRADWPTVELS